MAKIRYTISTNTPTNHAERLLFVTSAALIVAMSTITTAPGQNCRSPLFALWVARPWLPAPRILGLAVGVVSFVGILVWQGVGEVATALGVAGAGLLVVAAFHLVPLAADALGCWVLLERRGRPPVRTILYARWVGEAETGQVFERLSESPVSDLHVAWGMGFRAVVRPQVVAFVDVLQRSSGMAHFRSPEVDHATITIATVIGERSDAVGA